MALMAFIPDPWPSQGKLMCWHRWILPFLVELWVCLGNTAICWITRPSTPSSARTAPVPGSALKMIQGCQAGLKSHGKPGGWAGNRAAMSRRAAFCAHYRFWAQQQHWQDGPAGEPQDSPRAQRAPPEAAAKGEFTALKEPKIHLKLTTCGCAFFTIGDYLGWKCLLPPSHQLLCAAGIQLLRLDLINAHMGRFVWPGRWYYWIGLSNLSVSLLTIFMNI